MKRNHKEHIPIQYIAKYHYSLPFHVYYVIYHDSCMWWTVSRPDHKRPQSSQIPNDGQIVDFIGIYGQQPTLSQHMFFFMENSGGDPHSIKTFSLNENRSSGKTYINCWYSQSILSIPDHIYQDMFTRNINSEAYFHVRSRLRRTWM